MYSVCYAGSNIGVNETKHLKIIDNELIKNKVNIKILYRLHPWKNFIKRKKIFLMRIINTKIDYFSILRYKTIFKKPKK